MSLPNQPTEISLIAANFQALSRQYILLLHQTTMCHWSLHTMQCAGFTSYCKASITLLNNRTWKSSTRLQPELSNQKGIDYWHYGTVLTHFHPADLSSIFYTNS